MGLTENKNEKPVKTRFIFLFLSKADTTQVEPFRKRNLAMQELGVVPKGCMSKGEKKTWEK